jgi:hypothetical protein
MWGSPWRRIPLCRPWAHEVAAAQLNMPWNTPRQCERSIDATLAVAQADARWRCGGRMSAVRFGTGRTWSFSAGNRSMPRPPSELWRAPTENDARRKEEHWREAGLDQLAWTARVPREQVDERTATVYVRTLAHAPDVDWRMPPSTWSYLYANGSVDVWWRRTSPPRRSAAPAAHRPGAGLPGCPGAFASTGVAPREHVDRRRAPGGRVLRARWTTSTCPT